MPESSIPYMQRRQSLQFSWLATMVVKPGEIFKRLTQQPVNWFTPMLVVSIAMIFNVLATGWLNQQAAINGSLPTPPDFQYWAPEQQTQYLQSQQVRQGPVFLYVIPAITSLTSIWAGWLIVSGILHLALTLLGGRGETNFSYAIVAWSNLPFIFRSVFRTFFLIGTHELITSPGLSGFVSESTSTGQILLTNFLSLVDIYLIWHILLLILGVKICTGIATGKSTIGVLSVIIIILFLQTLLGYFSYQISSITIIRPFFF